MSEPPRSITRTYVSYLGIRLLLFGATLAICIVLGMNGLLAVVVALLVSGVIAFPFARHQRDEIARALQQRRGGR